MAYREIIVETKDRIATITLNRPERMNAWTDVMAEEVHGTMLAESARRTLPAGSRRVDAR